MLIAYQIYQSIVLIDGAKFSKNDKSGQQLAHELAHECDKRYSMVRASALGGM